MIRGRPRFLALVLMVLIMGVLSTVSGSHTLSPQPAKADGGIGGITVNTDPPRASAESMVDIFRRVSSGTAWVMMEGLDPRLQRRPGWDPITRINWGELIGFGPALQAPGAALVPFRSPAPAFSRNILLTRDFSNAPFQTEPHIAVDPTDPKHLVVGVIDYAFPSIASYSSFDGGQTWEGPYQVPYARDDLASAGDPVVAFDTDGTVHFASITIGLEEFAVGPFVFEALVSGIAHSTSGDGGLTWSESISTARAGIDSDLSTDLNGQLRGQVLISFLDKPWMAVGPNPDGSTGSMVYMTYTDFTLVAEVLYIGDIPAFAVSELRSTIKMVRSEDGGATWSPEPMAVSPTVTRTSGGGGPGPGEGISEGLQRVVQGSFPTVAPDGTLYVAWMDTTNDDSQEGLAEIYVARSEDGGRSFTEPVRASLFQEPAFRSKRAFFRSWGTAFPRAATGPEGEVYVVYGGRNAGKPTDDGDVYFISSLDRGESWSRAKRLGGDDSDSFQFFPTLTTDPKGDVHVMWGDMRDDPAGIRYHMYYTRSDDQGRTWGFEDAELNFSADDTRITDFGSNSNKGFPSGLFIGDYFGIAATEDDLYAVWADTRLGEFGGPNQKIAFARRSSISSSEVFLSPGAGPGGQEVTLQGFNFQPDLNVFIQVGGVTVATERTNDEGRFSSQLFMPVAGEGAQSVLVFDESGNVATSSFFTEFGFGSIQDIQGNLEEKIDELESKLAGGVDLSQLQTDMEQVRLLLQDGGGGGGGTPWWGVVLLVLAGAGLAATGAAYLTRLMLVRRPGNEPSGGEPSAQGS